MPSRGVEGANPQRGWKGLTKTQNIGSPWTLAQSVISWGRWAGLATEKAQNPSPTASHPPGYTPCMNVSNAVKVYTMYNTFLSLFLTGYYCDAYALTVPAGECLEGYYCPEGSSRIDQIDCPVGHYCINATFDPEPCPAGMY